MSAGNLGMLEYGADALACIGADPAEAALCARLIARYAVSPDDGDLLAEALGLEVPARDLDLAGRITRLADSIPRRYNSAYRRAVPDGFQREHRRPA